MNQFGRKIVSHAVNESLGSAWLSRMRIAADLEALNGLDAAIQNGFGDTVRVLNSSVRATAGSLPIQVFCRQFHPIMA
jgi:hypothetical protein